MLTTSPDSRTDAHHALANAGLRKALAFSKPQLTARCTAAVANLPNSERRCDPASRALAEFDDAVTNGFMPHDIMLVADRSGFAGIERTLELGAQGPRRLHVALVGDDPADRAA